MPHISNLLRQIFFLTAQYSFSINIVHIPGHFSKISDLLSCLQIAKYRTLVQRADENHPSASLESLLRDLIYFDHLALVPSSRQIYDTAHNQFLSFCTAMHFVPYPVNEDCLHLFVVSLARCVSPNTIQVYLSSLRFFNI